MAADLALRHHLSEKGVLDRFEGRAIEWAEKAGIRWVELEGELWTLVSELERKKGVEQEDFRKHAGLSETSALKGRTLTDGVCRLLQEPGVRRAMVPTAFQVEGGYAISCGGPHAKAGITRLVRAQQPDWAKLSQYTLVNVPLALSYLMHGRSDLAKATRDLTISTTIDVGQAAAARSNASAAVQLFGGDAEVAALMSQLMAKIHERALQALDTSVKAEVAANRAESKADDAKAIAAQAIQIARTQAQFQLQPRAKQPTAFTRQALYSTWRKHFHGLCPCCHAAVDSKNLEIDHWTTRNKADAAHLWLICRGCNTRLGKPELDGGTRRSDTDRKRFTTFQELMNLPNTVQCDLDLCA